MSFIGQETGGRSTVEPGQAGWRRDAGTSVNDGPFCLSVIVRLSRLAIGGDARLTVIIDFIILTVNLVNPAIASLYFRPSQKNSTRWFDGSSFRICSARTAALPAGASLTTGNDNTAAGFQSLYRNDRAAAEADCRSTSDRCTTAAADRSFGGRSTEGERANRAKRTCSANSCERGLRLRLPGL